MKNTFLNLFIKANKAVRRKTLEYYQSQGLLIIDKNTYGIHNLEIHTYRGSESKIIIGKYSSIGPKVTIITGGIHPTNWVSTYPFRIKWNLPGKYSDGMPSSNGEVRIGNDVWIGTDVIILSGVKIGNGAIIASGTIVTKDVKPYSIVAGNPAKLIKLRFDEEKIEALLKIKWWDWEEDKILSFVHLISSQDIDSFIMEATEKKVNH